MTQSDKAIMAQRLVRFQDFLKEDPDNKRLRMDVFALALAVGEYELAREQIEIGMRSSPDDAEWRYRQASLASAKGDFFGAEAVLELLAAEGNSTPAVLYELAYVQFRQGKNTQAMALLQHLVANASQEVPAALPLLMRCMQKEGHAQDALKLFRDHLGDVAMVPEAWGLAGLFAVDVESLAEAEEWAQQALALSPRQREALITMGTLALARQDVTGAKKYLEQCIVLYPESGRCWSALGLTHMQAQEMTEAAVALEKAVRLMPSHIGTWHGLGWCRIAQKNFTLAHAAFESALELDHNFAESHGGLAVALISLQQIARAQEHVARALRLDSRCVSGLLAQALLQGDGRDIEAVRKMAQRLLGQRKTFSGKSMADIVLRMLH
jgi:tetratricopeptide (TPR) repeat protein